MDLRKQFEEEHKETIFDASFGSVERAYIQWLEQRLEASPLETLVSGAEWIRVEDKLPHEFKTVLFWVPEYENIVTGYLDGRSGNLIKHSDTVIGEVTHWAKLPEPPKEYH